MIGVERIQAERERQVVDEDWTLAHDDTHTDGELAQAAVCYAQPRPVLELFASTLDPVGPPDGWPWEPEAWKPTWSNGPESLYLTPQDRIRDLAKAGALIAAEIDRLARVQETRPAP